MEHSYEDFEHGNGDFVARLRGFFSTVTGILQMFSEDVGKTK